MVLSKLRELNAVSNFELDELVRTASAYQDKSLKQYAAIGYRLLTPISGDRDIYHLFEAIDRINPVVTHGPSALPPEQRFQNFNGPYGPLGATTRVVMAKYVVLGIALVEIFTLYEKLMH